MKTLTVILTLLSQVALAAPKTDSYYIKTMKNNEVNTEVCDDLGGDEDGAVFQYHCFMGDPAAYYGYSLRLIAGDHAMVPVVHFFEEEVPYDSIYADHEPGSGASHFYGPTGVVEVRYKNDSSAYEMKKVPFALIVRMDTSRAVLDGDGNVVFKGSDQELLVFHLDGKNTKLAGKVNARAKGANQKARQLADALLQRK